MTSPLIESLKLEHAEWMSIFIAVLGFFLTTCAGFIAAWLTDKVEFNIVSFLLLVIVGLVTFIVEERIYTKMKMIRKRITESTQ